MTHDLSQISSSDFVYVLKGGRVVEQGYRYDLEQTSGGDFKDMMDTQGATGGFLPQTEDVVEPDQQRHQLDAILEQAEAEKEAELEAAADDAGKFNNLKHKSLTRPALRPATLGNWMFDTVQKQQLAAIPDRPFVPADAFANDTMAVQLPMVPSPTHAVTPRRHSLQFTPTSPNSAFSLVSSTRSLIDDDDEFDVEKSVMTRSAAEASLRRPSSNLTLRTRWDESRLAPMTTIKVEKPEAVDSESSAQSDKELTFWQLMREIYPTVPYKFVILIGLVICVLSGAMTPIFSFLLSRLMFEVSIGAQDTSTINIYGGIVLGIAAMDGLLLGLKYFIMETTAMAWVTRVRNTCFKLVLSQDKKWFDKSDNSSVRIVQILIKDGDDARTLIGTVLAQSFVVCSMLGVGLIWAMIQGWQLTLVGFAIAPVFALTMTVQTNLVSKCEVRNKRARESVAKGYYEVSHRLALFFRLRALIVSFYRRFRTSAVSAPWRSSAFSRRSSTRQRMKHS
jgi:ATP-binding cassette subfamily B (MDR/TAP) protein 1